MTIDDGMEQRLLAKSLAQRSARDIRKLGWNTRSKTYNGSVR